ncbi:hypothetical protein DL769_005482 [Monosporascus sp. CRB-8-3]|nr:hypothetical protein DL769_005482 [Monosporascus sp. CRB-8-3]
MTLPSSKLSKTASNVPYGLLDPWLTHPVTARRSSKKLVHRTPTPRYVKDGMNGVLAQYDAASPPPFASPVLRRGDLVISQTSNILQYLGWRLGLARRRLARVIMMTETAGIDGVKSAFLKFVAAAEKSGDNEREFELSWASDYYRIWMSDNGFIMVHIIHTEIVNMYSALKAADISDFIGIPMADLDLRTLATDFVWKEDDWQNEVPRMPAFAPIHFILAGLLGPAGEAGLVREIAVTETQIVGTIGSFQLNTVAHCLKQAANNWRGGYLNLSKIADELPTELSSVFDDTKNNIEALTAKLFGGTSSKTLQRIDLMEFVNAILPATDGEERMGNEAHAPWYLLHQNYPEWEESTDTLRSYFLNSFQYMKVGLIGHLFRLKGLYVMHFAWLESDRCHNEFEGASRYIDNGCFVLKVGGGGWRHLNHDDNAPTELKLAEDKYHLHLPNFFRNVRDCNNDERMMAHDRDAMGDLGSFNL